MKLHRSIFMLFVLLLLCSKTELANAEDDHNYRLSSDDKISIIVFNEPGLSIEEIKIGTNGTISMPLIGQVTIKGLTVSEVEETISDMLLDGYLKSPNISVSILEYRPFYISGEVKNPGGYSYRKDLTIKKAVALAGGFTERASKGSISVVGEDSQRILDEVSLDVAVKPGDVITVSESFF